MNELVHEDGLQPLEAVPRQLPDFVLRQPLPGLPKFEQALFLDPLNQLSILAVFHHYVQKLLLVVADDLFDGNHILMVDTFHCSDLVLDILVHENLLAGLGSLFPKPLDDRLFPLQNLNSKLLHDSVLLLFDDEHVPV